MGKPIITLVVNRATDNFIDEALVLRRNLERVETKQFRVTNARGYQTKCKWMIRDLELTIGSYTIIIDFYVYPMGGFPLTILGVQWLYQLRMSPSMTKS